MVQDADCNLCGLLRGLAFTKTTSANPFLDLRALVDFGKAQILQIALS